MKCKECGYDIGEDAKFCGKCGKPVISISNKVKCKDCGKEIDSNVDYCPKCGKSTFSESKDRKGRKRREDDDGEDDDNDGGILGGVGDIIGKIFG